MEKSLSIYTIGVVLIFPIFPIKGFSIKGLFNIWRSEIHAKLDERNMILFNCISPIFRM